MTEKTSALDPMAAETAVQIARRSWELTDGSTSLEELAISALPDDLVDQRSSFVTITNHGKLRGCIGSTDAQYPLAEDIARNAISASSRDYRFPPISTGELPDIRLEVTILTRPVPLFYQDYEELVGKFKPGTHGVILTSGTRKGLLLPQVWDRLPDVDRFLEMIALKAGIPKDDLKDSPPSVNAFTFEAHHYCELGYLEPGS